MLTLILALTLFIFVFSLASLACPKEGDKKTLEKLMEGSLCILRKIHLWVGKDGFPSANNATTAGILLSIVLCSLTGMWMFIRQAIAYALGEIAPKFFVLSITLLSFALAAAIHSVTKSNHEKTASKLRWLLGSMMLVFPLAVLSITWVYRQESIAIDSENITSGISNSPELAVGIVLLIILGEFACTLAAVHNLHPIGMGWLLYIVALPFVIFYALCWTMNEGFRFYHLRVERKQVAEQEQRKRTQEFQRDFVENHEFYKRYNELAFQEAVQKRHELRSL